eukprot:532702_1
MVHAELDNEIHTSDFGHIVQEHFQSFINKCELHLILRTICDRIKLVIIIIISLKQQLYIQRCTAKNDINYGTMIQKKVSQSNILNHQINRNQKYIIIILQIFALFKQEGTFRPVCVTLIEDKETFRFEFMFGDRKVRKRLNMHVKY